MTRMPMPSDSDSARVPTCAVFCGEVAVADVHHAGVGVGGAAHASRFQAPNWRSRAS